MVISLVLLQRWLKSERSLQIWSKVLESGLFIRLLFTFYSKLLVALKFVTGEYTTYWQRGCPLLSCLFFFFFFFFFFFTRLVSRLYRLNAWICMFDNYMTALSEEDIAVKTVLCLFIAWVQRDRGFFLYTPHGR